MLNPLLLAVALLQTPANPPVVQISIDSVRAKIPKYGFPAASKAPSPYMSDAFGVLRLNSKLTRDGLLNALVPNHGRLVTAPAGGPIAIELQNGLYVEFYINASLAIGTEVPPLPRLNFAVVPEALTSGNADPHLAALLELFDRGGLTAQLLEPNPFFAEEELAHAAMQKGAQASGTHEPGGFDAFARERNALLLVPDRVHGDTVRYREMVALIRKPEVEWVALEMISTELNPVLRAYHESKPGTPEHAQARRAIMDYYLGSWNNRFGVETPERNHYFQLIELARSLGKPVYGLDTNLEYVLFRYGEFPLGGSTRNVIWARQLPATGRGLVFGGSGHMAKTPGNVQHFLRELRPELRVFNVDPR